MSERYLDHLDAEQRRVRVLIRRETHTPGKLVRRTYAAGAGDVDIDVVGIFRVDEQAVRVGSTAGLNVANVFRITDIAYVEDANPAQSILADGVLHTLSAAVDSGGQILARDEQQIPVHGDVALRGWTHVSLFERRLLRIADVPDLVAAEASLKDVVAEESEVGVDPSEELLRRFRLRQHL